MKLKEQLEEFLKQTQADQGGEATFEEFVAAVAEDPEEYGHFEAIEFLKLHAA